MKDNNNTKTNQPSHFVYSIENFGSNNESSNWTKIGSGWSHQDGKGINLQIGIVPLNGKITIREVSDVKEA